MDKKHWSNTSLITDKHQQIQWFKACIVWLEQKPSKCVLKILDFIAMLLHLENIEIQLGHRDWHLQVRSSVRQHEYKETQHSLSGRVNFSRHLIFWHLDTGFPSFQCMINCRSPWIWIHSTLTKVQRVQSYSHSSKEMWFRVWLPIECLA